jgi:hypothetical protein
LIGCFSESAVFHKLAEDLEDFFEETNGMLLAFIQASMSLNFLKEKEEET